MREKTPDVELELTTEELTRWLLENTEGLTAVRAYFLNKSRMVQVAKTLKGFRQCADGGLPYRIAAMDEVGLVWTWNNTQEATAWADCVRKADMQPLQHKNSVAIGWCELEYE